MLAFFSFQIHLQFVINILYTGVEENLNLRRESQSVIWKFRNSKQFVLKCITGQYINCDLKKHSNTLKKKPSKAQANKPKHSNNLQWKGWTFFAKALINLEALQVAAQLKWKVQVNGIWYNDVKVL